MTIEIAIFLIIFVVTLLMFIFEWFPADVTALGIMVVLVVLGLLSPDEAFAGFGSDVALMILGLLILTQALVETGVVDATGRLIIRRVGENPRHLQLLLIFAPAALSIIVSNTAASAFFMPIALGLARRARLSLSRVLMPMAFATILASSMTLISTSTNLIVSGLMEQQNLAPLSMFELTPVGLPILIVGVVYMYFIGRHVVPDRTGTKSTSARYDSDVYVSEIVIGPASPLVGQRLSESSLKEDYELQTLRVTRHDQQFRPGNNLMLREGDELMIQGTRENIIRAQSITDVVEKAEVQSLETYTEKDGKDACIAEVVILPGSPLVRSRVGRLGLQRRYGLNILASNQGGKIIYNKFDDLRLQIGDTLLVQLPEERLRQLEQDRLFRVLDILKSRLPTERYGVRAILIFVLAILLAVLNVLPVSVAMLLGALMVFVTGCITPDQAYSSIEWRTLIIIGSMLAFGRAMQTTGTASYLADIIADNSHMLSPHLLLGMFFVMAVILTQPMSNQAAAAVLVPVAVETALSVGYDPRAFVVMIAVAASTSYITPLEPACMIIYGVGQYRFTDFIKVGLPLTGLVFVIAMLIVPLLWPM